jgi:hypothetical protein
MAAPMNVSDNLIKWDLANAPLAPLTTDQKLKLSSLENEITSTDLVNLNKSFLKIESLQV